MKLIKAPIFLISILILGCSSAPPIQRTADTKSYFDGAVYPGEIYKIAEDNSGAE
jgi:uncharacterized protein YcfL